MRVEVQCIRRCTPDDAHAVAAIYDPIVADTMISFEDTPPGPEEMRRRIVAAGDLYPWLAFDRGGEVLGYAYASPHRSRAGYRWSVDVSVYVSSSARRSGVARALYSRLFDVLARQGYYRPFAGVALPNKASTELHESVGFTAVGIYHRVGFKFGKWHDVQWFERRLIPDDSTPSELRLVDLPQKETGEGAPCHPELCTLEP